MARSVGLRNVLAMERLRAERARAVAAHEEIDVADVLGLEDDSQRRRLGVEPLPHIGRASGGASASSRATSPPDSTHVEVTGGSQPWPGSWSGWSMRQIHRPGATSRSSSVTAGIVPATPRSYPIANVTSTCVVTRPGTMQLRTCREPVRRRRPSLRRNTGRRTLAQ